MRTSLALIVLLSVCACSTAARAPAPVNPLPGLVHTTGDKAMFPIQWNRSGIRAQARSLPNHRRAAAYRLVERAIAQYPSGFVEAHLERIYVFDWLSFRGVRAGGSNSLDRIYIVLPTRGRSSDAHFLRVFHAEFSSVLLRHNPSLLDRTDWLRGTVPGFRYGASGAGAVSQGLADVRPSDWTLKQGFLYEYGMSSLENDFNSYAAYLFVHPERLASFAARHPGVAHKRTLAARFYEALDPRFAQ